eukprot:scaffold50814_cov41-Attheya_sp.AAC.6
MSTEMELTGTPARHTWDQSYEELQSFFDEHGHSNVPAKAGRLGMWVIRQRHVNKPKLTSMEIEKLNTLNFDWETKSEKDDKMWDFMFSHLLKFIEENTHARVPCNYLAGEIRLGRWVTSQQKLHRKSKIRDDRRRRLKAVGFLWVRDERLVWTGTERTLGKADESWNRMYQHLVDFKMENDHCMVSVRTFVTEEDDDGVTSQQDLGTWVSRQRAANRDGSLKEDRKKLLEAIGFAWKINHFDAEFSLRQRQWDEMYEKLGAFKEEHGHCRITVDYEADPVLGKWVKNQRIFEKKGKLDESRFEKLDCLGFVWDQIESRWKDMLQKLNTFKDEHGHCQVPVRCPTNRTLGTWVMNQRMFETNGTLDDKKYHLLNEVGFVWDPANTRWNIMLNHLRDYTLAHGNIRIPSNYITADGTHLGSWARTQKNARNSTKKKSHLTTKRIAELDAAGFVWDNTLDEQWNTMYESLKKYKEDNGDFRVPHDYKCYDKQRKNSYLLGAWVSHQKQNRNKTDKKFLKRKAKLDAVGFNWGIMGNVGKKPKLGDSLGGVSTESETSTES